MKTYEIERYSASHPDWEGSFSERLYEYNEWDKNEFWKLHKEFIELAIFYRDKECINKELTRSLLGIQKSIYAILISHFDKESFKITNLNDEEIYEFKERLDMAILGITTGEVLPESGFDLVNPLIK